MTHEQYIATIRDLALSRVGDSADVQRIRDAKLVYGIGTNGVRGVTYYSSWQNGKPHDFMEISAQGEQSPVQLAGTTIHEMAHVLAGHSAGHGKDWKACAATLGLIEAQAAGQDYCKEHFDPELWAKIETLTKPVDGKPMFGGSIPFVGGLPTTKVKACPLGFGTRGGTSRGKGSGSRMRLYVCEHGQKVRAATDELNATCNVCGKQFKLAA